MEVKFLRASLETPRCDTCVLLKVLFGRVQVIGGVAGAYSSSAAPCDSHLHRGDFVLGDDLLHGEDATLQRVAAAFPNLSNRYDLPR